MKKEHDKKHKSEGKHMLPRGQGVTSLAMKTYGRNLARAMNQRGSSRGK
jgi:hypothetical protein